ncbi:MAG: hypothetical protein U0457_21840 [Candidatus Sericytochromatia bacterium]
MLFNKLSTFIVTSLVLSFTLLSCKQPSPYAGPASQPLPNDPIPTPSTVNAQISTGMGSVIGRVVDPSGKGLQGVSVSINGNSTSTGFNGDFQLNNVPAGNQIITFTYGSRELKINASVSADTASSPDLNPVQFSNNGTNGSGIANTQLKTFQVDQDFLNQWQAKSVAVMNNIVYVAAIDVNGLITTKGTIIRLDAETGQSWKDLGSKWFVRHPMDKTLQALAVSSSNIIAVDTKGSVYNIEANKAVQTYKAGGGTDIAIAGGNVYIVNGSNVEKTDTTGQSRTAVKDFSVSGGICADGKGNVYGVSGKTIKKAEFTTINANIKEVVKDGLESPIDVAVDDKTNSIYVLDGSNIKRFNDKGVLLATFGASCIKPVSIATDEYGQLYVADEGKDHKTSKIVKFASGTNVIPNFQNQDTINANKPLEDAPSDETES